MWKVISSFRVSASVPALRLQQLQFKRRLSENQEVSSHDNICRVKISVPFWATANIFGNYHENFKVLGNRHKAKIRVSSFGEYFPGSGAKERVVLIEGENEAVVDIVHRISNLLRTMDLPESHLSDRKMKGAKSRKNAVKVIFPNALAGKLIGKSGTMRQKIQEQHKLEKCIIEERNVLHNHIFSERLNERSIYLRGEEQNVKSAVDFIIQMLDAETEHRLCDNLSYKKFRDLVSSWVRLKVLVPFYMMQYVRNTENGTQKMEEELGIKFHTSRLFYPDTREKVALLEGPQESVMKALQRISNIIRSSELPDNLSSQDLAWAEKKRGSLMLLLNNDALAKHFVDKEQLNNFSKGYDIGLHIKRKMSLTGENRCPINESMVFIEGKEGNVLKAVDKLIETIDYKVVDCNLDYEQFYQSTKSQNAD